MQITSIVEIDRLLRAWPLGVEQLLSQYSRSITFRQRMTQLLKRVSPTFSLGEFSRKAWKQALLGTLLHWQRQGLRELFKKNQSNYHQKFSSKYLSRQKDLFRRKINMRVLENPTCLNCMGKEGSAFLKTSNHLVLLKARVLWISSWGIHWISRENTRKEQQQQQDCFHFIPRLLNKMSILAQLTRGARPLYSF